MLGSSFFSGRPTSFGTTTTTTVEFRRFPLMAFQDAVAYVNSGQPIPVDNETKLTFYKYYKQATIGDCNVSQPGLLDVKGRAKWNAWNQIKGMSKAEASWMKN